MDYGFGAVTLLLFAAYLLRKVAEKAITGKTTTKRPVVDVDFTEVPNEQGRRTSGRPAHQAKRTFSGKSKASVRKNDSPKTVAD